jgi:hypothetical protein
VNFNPKTIALVAFGAVVLGAFLPWAKIGPISASGTDGDGIITLFLGLGGAALIGTAKNHLLILLAVVGASLTLAIGIYDVSNILSQEATLFGSPQAGAGLWLTVVASVVALVTSGMRWRELHTQPLQALGTS